MENRFKFICGVQVCCYSDDGEDKEVIIRFEPDTITKDGEVGFDLVFLMDKLKKLGLSKHELYTAKDFIICNYETSIEDWCIANPEYLVQCTGINDKNGKLIFEGDIVINLLNKESPYYQVKWDSEYLSYCFEAVGNSEDLDVEMPLEIVYEGYHEEKYKNRFYDIFEPSRTEIKYLEVIGNIHENPELLEMKND